MKHNYYSRILLVASILLFSCSPEQENTKNLYDLKELFKSQQEVMKKIDPKVRRISELNNITDTIVHNELDWEEELSFLSSMDINNSKFRDDYQQESGSAAGLNYLQFSLEKPDGSFDGILDLKIWFREAATDPIRIEIKHQPPIWYMITVPIMKSHLRDQDKT